MFRNENDKTARRSAEAKAKTVARRKLEDTAALESDISSPIPRSERVPTDTVLCRRADQLLLAPPRIVISLSSTHCHLALLPCGGTRAEVLY
jgi:hypothetical protein